MNPFISAQLTAITQGLHLLEALVTSPLGLYSDLKMLRESMPSSQQEEPDRGSLMGLTSQPLQLALETISAANASLSLLEGMDGPAASLDLAWVQRARKVLARAEQRVAGELRQERAFRIQGLYVIVDPELTGGRPVAEITEAALKGGTRVIQLRDKAHDKGDLLPVARQLKALCEQHDATFIVNDHADLALASQAHGLHVGQHDLPVPEARQVLKPLQLVGKSNALIEEALESQAQGADYIAVGSIFPTATKGVTRPAGLETLARVKESVTPPVVAIGGISRDNVEEVVRAGADCVCVVSAVSLAEDPQDAAQRLVDKIERAKSKGGKG